MKKKFGDLGDFEIKEDQIEMIEGVTSKFKDKSDDEIFVEIINLNEQMAQDLSFEEYEAIFEQLDEIRHLLSEDQLEKLDRILRELGR
ncbi:MAG: hypothetical protein GX053_07885 [Tissierella sp.]|nr:hypothetical protein [Tissierella sp.]